MAAAALRSYKNMLCEADAAKKVAEDRAAALATARRAADVISLRVMASTRTCGQKLLHKFDVMCDAEHAAGKASAAAAREASQALARANAIHARANGLCRHAALLKAQTSGFLRGGVCGATHTLGQQRFWPRRRVCCCSTIGLC